MSGRRDAGLVPASKRTSAALTRASAQIDRAMRRFIDRQPLGDFYDLVRYQLGWNGFGKTPPALPRQHLPASLALLVCQACGRSARTAMPLAVSIGLMHEFGAIQEDLESQCASHGSRPTVWALWGRAQAMNAGDGLHALAKVALLEGRRRLPSALVLHLAEEVDQCWLRICEATHERMRSDVPSSETLELMLLCACAAYGGCLLAGGDQAACARLREFGEMLGRMCGAVQAGQPVPPGCRDAAQTALQACGFPTAEMATLEGLPDVALQAR